MTQKLKILVIDDEPSVTKYVGRLLAGQGYDVILANDSRKVEEYIIYTDLSLIITDLRMPGLDGFEVIKLVKSVKPDLPVLMLTGVSDIAMAVEATKLGAEEYLTKPIDNRNLVRKVKDHIKVDQALDNELKDLIESNPLNDEGEATSPDKILLPGEITTTDSIPDGLVEINFRDIMPGQFLNFPLFIQILNKFTGKYYLRKINNENTVFTSGLKDILTRRNLGSVYIKEKDYKYFLEYFEAVKTVPSFKHQQVQDSRKLLLYGKAIEAVSDILSEPVGNRNIEKAIDVVDDIFRVIVDDPVTYQDMYKLFKKNMDLFNHTANVCLLCTSFGLYLKLKPSVIKVLGMGAMFHDLGMNRIDRKILEKRGALTRDEWNEIKKHPERGFAQLKASRLVPVPALRIVLEHHEEENGGGYPRGLKLSQINMLSRLCRIVDKYDGMTTEKTYRAAFKPADALKRIYLECPNEKIQNLVRKFIQFLGGHPAESS